MAAINISPAASPVILDNPPIIGDQYLALSVLDRVANETLRVKTPFVLHYMDQLVGAMASALGSHIRLLSSRNEHPNSHGIIAKSDVNGVTWTWPNLYHHVTSSSIPRRGGGTHLHMHPPGATNFAKLQIREGWCMWMKSVGCS